MTQGEKIVVVRAENGWIVCTDFRREEDGSSRDSTRVAKSVDEMLDLVRIEALDQPTQKAQ